MQHSAELHRCLEQCDITGARALWASVAPHLPQPQDDAVTLVTIHMARTQVDTISFQQRAWSHRWLTERNLPSQLPDHLRPKAERMYPRIVEGVGIAVKVVSPQRRELANAIQKAMSDAVLECYANGETDPVFVKARMQEARMKVFSG